jgi:2-polyprenyl-3-methyl-5-hydroxy-6-metoxy-1,4-benzoquinol methylase
VPLDINKLEILKLTLSANQIDQLDLYVNEANFIYSLIEEDLNVEPMNFYEIGSGIGLLSRMVAEKGHNVIATEPATSGFGVVKVLQKVIEESFVTDSKTPIYYSATAEDLTLELQEEYLSFDYIFCANVVEHVINLSRFFDAILPLKSQKGTFRFVCPNYTFPYEPHFGFITLFSKKLTYIFYKKRIQKLAVQRDEDLVEFYKDLSFPTIRKINRILKKSGFKIEFNTNATKKYILRTLNDEYFAKRKKVISSVVKIVSKPLLYILWLPPKSLLPIIDCNIKSK